MMDDRLSDIKFTTTYKVTGSLTFDDVDLKNLKNTVASEFLKQIKDVKIVLDKVSPAKVRFGCPTKGCDLRWVHRVIEDFNQIIPVNCAYCKRKGLPGVKLVRIESY